MLEYSNILINFDFYNYDLKLKVYIIYIRWNKWNLVIRIIMCVKFDLGNFDEKVLF